MIKIFVLYSGIVCIWIIYLFYGLFYKRNVFKALDKKVHKYRFLYGVSALIIDYWNKYIRKINYEEIKIRLNRMNVSVVTDKDAYIDLVSRMSLAVLFFSVITVGGYIKCSMDFFEKDKEIKFIERPEYGEGDINYNIVIKDEDNESNINVNVIERVYSKQEVFQLFTDSYEILIKELLGDNESIDCITDDINLISGLDNGVGIEWIIEEDFIIDYSGKIKWLEIDKSCITKIEAIMNYGEYSQSYVIELILNKEKRNKNKLIKEDIEVLADNNDKTNKKINLEEISDKYNVKFIEKKDKESLVFIIYGLIVGILIFFAKGKDNEKLLEQRREELDVDYSVIISKLTILQSAGLNTINAWDKIIADYEKGNQGKRFAYEEMKYARKKMKAGCSESACYLEFGRRCGTHSYIKFANVLEQNLKKGTKGMKEILNSEALEERKVLARKKGDAAGTKLLIPMGIMLVISIIIIIVPALLNINV